MPCRVVRYVYIYAARIICTRGAKADCEAHVYVYRGARKVYYTIYITLRIVSQVKGFGVGLSSPRLRMSRGRICIESMYMCASLRFETISCRLLVVASAGVRESRRDTQNGRQDNGIKLVHCIHNAC